MIGLVSQNNIFLHALQEALGAFGAAPCAAGKKYDALIAADCLPQKLPRNWRSLPCLFLGQAPAGEQAVALPLSLAALIRHAEGLLARAASAAVFENSAFGFWESARRLTNKRTGETLSLTEKETAFLAFLAGSPGRAARKEELLAAVWNYHPETETHTVESHIYALRQKIGEDADRLIQTTDGGYALADG